MTPTKDATTKDAAPRASLTQMVGAAVAAAAFMISLGTQLWASKSEMVATAAVIQEIKASTDRQLAAQRESTDRQIQALKELTDKQIQALRMQGDQALLNINQTFVQLRDEMREDRRTQRGGSTK